MSRALAALAFFASLTIGSAVRADQPLYADLSDHLIAITTGFTGASVVLFGATDGPGDVVIVVRGPERDMVVRRKSRIGGIWLNTRQVTFADVPSYYAVYASSPLADIVPQSVQTLHQIGLANLRLQPVGAVDPETAAIFRAALLDRQRAAGVYADQIGKVVFLGDRLFRATLDFPATVPTGTYFIEVLLVRNQTVVSGQTTPLVVSQLGVNAEVGEFADRHALAYGVIAVFLAAVAGYLAGLSSRSA
jgi:uncharacterized protein (TIGR02186 family)